MLVLLRWQIYAAINKYFEFLLILIVSSKDGRDISAL